MDTSTIANIANAGQVSTGFIVLSAYMPQILKLYRSKSVGAIALGTWCAWILSSSLALFYAITQWLLHDIGLALVYTTGVCLAIEVMICVLLLYYRMLKEYQDKKLNISTRATAIEDSAWGAATALAEPMRLVN